MTDTIAARSVLDEYRHLDQATCDCGGTGFRALGQRAAGRSSPTATEGRPCAIVLP